MSKNIEQEREHETRQQPGRKGGEARKQELGHKGYQQMGQKGGETRGTERKEEQGGKKP